VQHDSTERNDMKKAHIITDREAEVGQLAYTLCGQEKQVKVLWANVPEDKPVCRKCLDRAVEVMDDANRMLDKIERGTSLAADGLRIIARTLGDEATELNMVNAEVREFQDRLAEDAEEAEEEERRQRTCTCTWNSAEEREPNIMCPIHGGEDTVKATAED